MSLAETNHNKKELPPQREMADVSNIPVLFLVGGRGTRVQTITNDEIPKPLIRISENHTIIDLICDNLNQLGYKNFIFCLGHHNERLKTHLVSRDWHGNSPKLSFSEEESQGLLGPAGAAYKAIERMKLSGPVFLLPGDMFLPWLNFREMLAAHVDNSADITFGVASVITERTSDIGKIMVEKYSNRLVKCYARNEIIHQPVGDNLIPLTSAGIVLVDAQRFSEMYITYTKESNTPQNIPLSIRDNILTWALAKPDNQIFTFDLSGEALDIGTEDRVLYARENWRNYMLDINKKDE